jgi:hypothetical protein
MFGDSKGALPWRGLIFSKEGAFVRALRYCRPCFVCREVTHGTVMRISEWNWSTGWHRTLELCGPCSRGLVSIMLEIAREYR